MNISAGKILSLFGVTVARPVLALLAGFAVITMFYMVPLLSLLIYLLVGIWALGTAVTATFNSARKEVPPRPPYAPTGPAPTNAPPYGTTGFATPPSGNFSATAETPAGTTASAFTPMPPPPTTAPVPEAYALPRAGFWERMGAAFLDVILVAFVVGFIAHSPPGRFFGPPMGLAVALAYFAGMWAWKGSTIGGTVLNLKVVRLDNQPVTFAVALVRGLASMLSFIVFFLGFFWIIVDRDKQAWHDKIAGTVVVRSPRATPLVCL